MPESTVDVMYYVISVSTETNQMHCQLSCTHCVSHQCKELNAKEKFVLVHRQVICCCVRGKLIAT